MAFDWTAHPQRITVTFSENVVASLLDSNLSVVTVPQTGQGTPVAFKRVSYDNINNVATFTPASGASLPDGNYSATLLPAGITDAAGNPLAAGRQIDFFVLSADADHDRTVGPSDFNLLATNFGKSNQPWAAGDFDGDGVVGPSDFNILATRFGTTLPPPQGQLVAQPPTSAVLSAAPLPTGSANTVKTTKTASTTRITPRVITARTTKTPRG
jgi:hypothetical protein